MTSPTTDTGAGTGAESTLLAVGRVVRPHALAGEVALELWTDITERLHVGATFESDAGSLRVAAVRSHQGRHLVKFEGVDSRDAAEALRDMELRAAPVHVEGALWVHELVGARVVTVDGRDLGTVVALEPNPASDLLVLEGGALVPLRFVTELQPGVEVTVDIPAGLVD